MLKEHPLTGVLPLVAEELVKQLEAAESQAQSIRRLILRKGMEHYDKSVRLLMTIPEFSALTSIALLSDIGDIKRFPTVKNFCCYLRLPEKVATCFSAMTCATEKTGGLQGKQAKT